MERGEVSRKTPEVIKLTKQEKQTIKVNDGALNRLNNKEECSNCLNVEDPLYYLVDPIDDTNYRILKLCEACYDFVTKRS